jgi:hypothetical protein
LNEDTSPYRWPVAVWVAGGVLFVLLATANGAGYRYGVSDQAFYIPVVTRSLDPAAFPRDASLIDAEGHLMVLDEILATVIRATGVSLETLYLTGYLVSMALMWTALVLIGMRVYRSPWPTISLAAAFTLRHRIPQTSANSFEPYFHPRMLAFALGALAVAAVLRRRSWTAVALVAVAAVIHITTGLWFAVMIGVALAVLDRRMRQLGIAAAVMATIMLFAAVMAGALRASNVTMDAVWLQAVASKDSLFATDWPLWAWLANLGMLALIWWTYRVRRRRVQKDPAYVRGDDADRRPGPVGDSRPGPFGPGAEDAALMWGATALVALFLVTLPLVAAQWALAVQFQISRVFWLVDLIATIYLIDAARNFSLQGSKVLAAILIAISTARGAYVMLVERPDRSLFEAHIADSPWQDAMQWMRRQPLDTHVLADPGHAWKYGTSVRVSAARDVYLEEVKDSAVAIYSRDVAVRVVERTDALGDFAALDPAKSRDLARRYDLDYLVTTADLALPLAYRNAEFRIYALQ